MRPPNVAAGIFSTWATPGDMVKAAKGLTGATVTAEELVRRLAL